jgi:hypothetical protein
VLDAASPNVINDYSLSQYRVPCACKLFYVFTLKRFTLNMKIGNKNDFFLFPTLIPLNGVGTTFFSSCFDKDSAFIFATGRLPDFNPP